MVVHGYQLKCKPEDGPRGLHKQYTHFRTITNMLISPAKLGHRTLYDALCEMATDLYARTTEVKLLHQLTAALLRQLTAALPAAAAAGGTMSNTVPT